MATKKKYKKPEMSKKMFCRLDRGIKDYKDADKFKKEFGVTPNYARVIYNKPKLKKDRKCLRK